MRIYMARQVFIYKTLKAGCVLLLLLVVLEIHLRLSASRCIKNLSHEAGTDAVERQSSIDKLQTFIIEEPDFCLERPELKIISYVHSSIPRVKKRNETRYTWATAHVYGISLAVVFMVGRAKSLEEEEIIRKESELYHDIVQGDYTDTYELLSYKGISSLVWLSRHCSHVPWILHADDDVMVNIFSVNELINSQNVAEDSFYCEKISRAHPRRSSVWKVSEEVYPCPLYPDYCRGPFWLLPTKLAYNLLIATKDTRFLWIDDVYITGLLSERAEIPKTHLNSLYLDWYSRRDEKLTGVAYLVLDEDRFAWWSDILFYYLDS